MNAKFAQIRAETLMLSKLAKFIIIVVMALASTLATQTQAATETGPIAVLDFVIPGLFPDSTNPNQMGPLDTSDTEVSGTLSVFQSHGTPLRSDGTLHLRRIRTTTAVLSDVSVKMHRRGATSTMFPKKSYALEFAKNALEFAEKPGSFLGMPGGEKGRDWGLHSCYMDSTCLRNVVAYWQASKLFPWAPRTEFVEVFINGYYRGLYVAIEKIKLGPNRVNLPEPTDNAFTNGITGGYILERASTNREYADPDAWESMVAPWTFWSYVSPKKSLTANQKSYIKGFMEDSFEPRFNPTFVSTYDALNYNKYLNEQSAVDFIIMQELSRNLDGYVRSMYITKHPLLDKPKYPRDLIVESRRQADGLIHMGPVWDFDAAFGNFNGLCDADSPNWHIDDDPNPRFGYQPLLEIWKTPRFREAMSNRWRTLRKYRTVSRGRFETKIDAFAARISGARARDNLVWKTLDAPNKVGRPSWGCRDNNSPTTFEAEITKLKGFTRARIAWMDAKISESRFLNP